ncbi:MAG: type I secretion C-terminal target domain-containing protein [Alphaproteobacteria bacterium]|nr:type I secretion C-terminal target domain-containing protein [Alphaproteobacteria bacterium]
MAVITGTSGDDILDGTPQADRISGLAGNDTLNGGDGNDTLDGGLGADTMNGGAGDDLYIVDDIGDVVNENPGEGRDRVQSSISYVLPTDVEDLTLTGTAAIDGTGNALNNTIIGNSGANRIDGGAGADYMDGGAGNDTYVVDDIGDVIKDKSGIDTVEASISWTLTAGLENLVLTGVADLNGTGNTAVNILTGNDGNNTLDGGKGKDTLIGGLGDDAYIVETSGDTIIELDGEGIDTVRSSITWTLGDHLENLTLTGTGKIHGFGNALDNVLTGNSADNTLSGGAGNDTLDGGGGKDTLIGGLGDDTYIVNDLVAVIVEQDNEGIDTMVTTVSRALAANVENLILAGAEAINGTGNALDNVMTGNDADNTLDGGLGADVMSGGLGDDTYIVDDVGDVVNENPGEGTDTVRASVSYTLSANVENLVLTGTADIDGTGNDLDNTLIGNTGINVLTGGLGDDTYVVRNSNTVIVEEAGEGTDTVETAFDYVLGANLENLTLTGAGRVNGTGNADVNIIRGNAADNTLDGGAGADTLIGGAGDDVYIVDDVDDVVIEADGEGTDTVFASVSYTLGDGIENLELTGVGDLDGTGNDLDNFITGTDGNNILDGGAGADILIGGLGDDTYVVDNIGDALIENANEGTDTVQASVNWTLTENFENLELTGTGNINGTGNSGTNTITGNSGANTLDGGGGTDTLIGGAGDDTYIVDSAGDVVIENLDEGIDTVISSISYTLGANLENLRLAGNAAINGTGNALDNTLTGNSAANILTGGDGDDTYVVDNVGDQVIEAGGQGTDTVRASISYTLAANVENLVLTGISAINGTGNGLDNIMTGNDGNNTLDGGAGNDTIDGGLGADRMIGGTGDDTFYVDNAADQVIELAAEGTDTVISKISWTLGANLENLVLAGTDDINGTGNALSNVITGNSGDNTINGGAGADVMDGGGSGDDVFFVDNAGDVVIAGSGYDIIYSSVNWVMGADQDELVLTGAATTGTGNGLDNVIRGNALNNLLSGGAGDDTLEGGAGDDNLDGGDGNDTLDGGTGIDVLTGGDGDDVYYVDNTLDLVIEAADEGEDIVYSRATYTLGANIEHLYLLGGANINATGNALDNHIKGNDGRNTLWGGDGNDTIDGGLGADRMIGGTGDDTYIVDNTDDVIQEFFGEGIDTVESSVSYTLSSHVENLVLTGEANINGTGNGLDNVLTGNAGVNILSGGDGNDTLDGGEGADTMIGGSGNDVYYVDNALDVIIDSSGTSDKVFSSVSYVLPNGIEILELTDIFSNTATGNALVNTLIGNSGDNRLDGGLGADTMMGGVGNDTYVVDNINDVVIEDPTNTGTPLDFTYVVGTITIIVVSSVQLDIIESSVTYTLPDNVEVLRLTGTASVDAFGNDGDNILAGNAGTNTLAGGLGDDYYIITDNKDRVIEDVGEGIDTVATIITYTLPVNIERLILIPGAGNINGTGNSLNNYLEGNEGINTLSGGLGNDIYKVGLGDVVIEGAGQGTDAVIATVSWTLGAHIEELYLDEEAGDINGTGNTMDNYIEGNTGNNTLNGGLGADIMVGGEGDDTYVVDNGGDVVLEFADEGIDTVMSSITYTLGANLENLVLTGTGNIDGTGNDFDNTLTGNSGRNTLTGGLGNDVYIVQNNNDVVVELDGEGDEDAVISSVTYTLPDFVEWLTLTGTAKINGTGNGLDNILTGNGVDNTLFGLDGNDTIDGGAGADRMVGGLGDDTYYVDNVKDTAVEAFEEGTDIVFSSVTFKLGANVENLTLIGEGNIGGTGNELDNILIGNDGKNSLSGGAGNDTLDGGKGADVMDGGAGDDVYYVDDIGDVVKDTAGGIDTVYSEVSFTLSNGVENLILVDGDINGKGNAQSNTIIGSGGNNIIDGGAGADYMEGGAGNDTYYVDNVGDVVVDSAGDEDHVFAAISYVLGADIERLTLTGKTALNGTGNNLDNLVTGNDGNNLLFGLGGNDTLDGGKGADTMSGGSGDDTYYVDNTKDVVLEGFGEGYDEVYSSVTFTLGEYVEKLVLTGKGKISATGNDQDNVLIGNDGVNTLSGGAGNDVLDGGLGADRMIGGLGDDTFYVDNAKDVVVELAGQGIDTVYSTMTYTLGEHLENLRLLGEAHINATGNAANNAIYGNDGNNIINGGGGIDRMQGGLGNDTYYVDNAGDSIIEFADEGIDTVYSSVSYDLFVNLENLILTGVDAINGRGNVLDNTLIGNSAANTLFGYDGDDTLDGGAGADTLIGGAGDDVYFIDNIGDEIIELTDEGIDTVYSSVTYTLGFQVENLFLTGKLAINATGNDLDNHIVGNTGVNILTGGAGNDTLDSGAGADTLIGGIGDDTYIIDNKKDVIVELAGEGNDTVVSAFTYVLGNDLENLTLLEGAKGKLNATGNAQNNILTGNSGINTLNGGAGADTMIGGGGNDLYVVDDLGDVVIEFEGGGIDLVQSSVSFALGAHVDNLTLTGTAHIDGTGNDLANTIIGNAGNNTLDGGAGADLLDGGAGDDTYVVDNLGDKIKDKSGVDTVIATVSWVLQSGLENLTLGGVDDINGIGNSAVNILIGNDGNNTLDGGAGNDTLIGGGGSDYLIGGKGNDTLIGGEGDDFYVIDTLGDVIIENLDEGIDTVETTVSYTLGANLENLILAGTSGIDGTGNALDNILTGNKGSNTLSGGDGNDTLFGGAGNDRLFGGDGDDVLYGEDGTDTLTGGLGADRFVFEAASAYKARDTITDFNTGEGDIIDIRDLLEMYDPLNDSLGDFVKIEDDGGNAILSVDRDGAGGSANWVRIATLQGINGLDDVDALVLSGNLLAT